MFGFSKKPELRTLANTSGQGVNVAVRNNATMGNAQKYVDMATNATAYFNKKDTLTTILARCESFKGDSVDKNSEFYNDIQSLILIRLLLSGDIVFKRSAGAHYKILGNIPDINSFIRDNNLSKEQINELSKVADEILKGDFNTNSIILNCIKKLGFKVFKKALFFILPGAGMAVGAAVFLKRAASSRIKAYINSLPENKYLTQFPDYAKLRFTKFGTNIFFRSNGQAYNDTSQVSSLTFTNTQATHFTLYPSGTRYINNTLEGLPPLPSNFPDSLRPPKVPTFTPPIINPLLVQQGPEGKFYQAEMSPGYPKVPYSMFEVPEWKAKFDVIRQKKSELIPLMNSASRQGDGVKYKELMDEFGDLTTEQQDLLNKFDTDVIEVIEAEQADFIEKYNEIRDKYRVDLEEYRSTILNGLKKWEDDYNTWALEYPEKSFDYFVNEDPVGIEQRDKINELIAEDKEIVNTMDHDALPGIGYFTLGVSILMILRQMQLSFRDEYRAFILAIIKLIDDFLVSKPIIMKIITSAEFTLPIISAANSNGKSNVPLYKNEEAVAVMWSYINKLNKRFEEPVKVQKMANFMLSPEARTKQRAWNSKPGQYFYRATRPEFQMTENPLFKKGTTTVTNAPASVTQNPLVSTLPPVTNAAASVTQNPLVSTLPPVTNAEASVTQNPLVSTNTNSLPNGWTEKESSKKQPGRKYYVSKNGKVIQTKKPTTVYNPVQIAGRSNTRRKYKSKFTRKTLRRNSRYTRPRRTLRKFRSY
jgi:hypothetical protein